MNRREFLTKSIGALVGVTTAKQLAPSLIQAIQTKTCPFMQAYAEAELHLQSLMERDARRVGKTIAQTLGSGFVWSPDPEPMRFVLDGGKTVRVITNERFTPPSS